MTNTTGKASFGVIIQGENFLLKYCPELAALRAIGGASTAADRDAFDTLRRVLLEEANLNIDRFSAVKVFSSSRALMTPTGVENVEETYFAVSLCLSECNCSGSGAGQTCCFSRHPRGLVWADTYSAPTLPLTDSGFVANAIASSFAMCLGSSSPISSQ